MSLVELTTEDADAVLEFFFELSAEERTFFWDDLTDPSVVARWVGDPRRSPMCVVEDGRVVAFAALVPQTEWSSHVAELVLVVASRARRRGHGRMLAQSMLIGALRRDFTKVTVQVAADQPGAIAMFQSIGFQAEALLRDHLREPETGRMRDLVILSHLVEETYAHLLAAGLDQVGE
ncbi:MAG TPA: GNAT family N-acetyltransferase [Sporichthya sp.]|jgi:L-amino acid N-acyltransferase YncA|nr:GNAT family N-acetyltransferase [Sporichthya sp.]